MFGKRELSGWHTRICGGGPTLPLTTCCSCLQTHNASLQRKLVERQADVTAQQAELAGVEAENKALRARVAAQTVHPADVQRMNSEK